jgi:hypothetical protein
MLQPYDDKYFNMAKTCLKVIKDRCFSLISLYHLKSCMSRSLTAWSQQVSLAERSRSSFALTVVCMFLPFSLPALPLTTVSVKFRLKCWILC